MTTLVIISVLLSVLGIGLATWNNKELPESMSALVYDLPKRQQWLWTLWIIDWEPYKALFPEVEPTPNEL